MDCLQCGVSLREGLDIGCTDESSDDLQATHNRLGYKESQCDVGYLFPRLPLTLVQHHQVLGSATNCIVKLALLPTLGLISSLPPVVSASAVPTNASGKSQATRWRKILFCPVASSIPICPFLTFMSNRPKRTTLTMRLCDQPEQCLRLAKAIIGGEVRL